MSKQNDSGAAPIALERAIKRWDYDKSVAKMRPLIREWKRTTEEMLRELYLAREYLNSQKGQRKNPEADNYLIHTWGGYCGEIGLSYQTANNWLKPFTPRELSETGKDMLMIEPPVTVEITEAERALAEARIEKVLRTGKRPSNWTDKEEAECRRRLENARFMKLAEELNMPAVATTKTDYFADILKRSKDIVNFKLDDHGQILAQAAIFDHIESYLNTFNNPETKERAAFNLVLKTRNRANEIAELNTQLITSTPGKGDDHDS
jgi:hypothetical protein